MADKRVTQQDIATKLGLHRSTVSLSLRNHPSISLATRQEVARLAEKLGYQPDPMLTALAAYRERNRPANFEGTLAWVFSSAGGFDWKRPPLYRQYFQGAQAQAQRHGYRLEVHDINSEGMTPRRMANILLARNIQGILLCPQPTAEGEIDLPWENFSAVTFGYTLKKPNLHRVTATQYRGIALVLSKLRELGYRKIGFALVEKTDRRVDHSYLAAYVVDDYLHGAHFNVPPLTVDHRRDHPALLEWIKRYQMDVVVTVDPLTLGILREHGVRVPEDVGLACSCLETTEGEMSGLCENSIEIGKTAVDFLVAMIHRGERGIPQHPHHLLVEGTWVPGKTVRKQRVASTV
ncbi:MAG: LacI family DNA-binding transcriptional regulator [Verrucomicrobiota bacterium JB024]|nr:LacI family DNA-binding transcriptional regulator [Verrucomicrobiota bacterium JB024]